MTWPLDDGDQWRDEDFLEKPLGWCEAWEDWPEESCGPEYWLNKNEAERERERGGDADSAAR